MILAAGNVQPNVAFEPFLEGEVTVYEDVRAYAWLVGPRSRGPVEPSEGRDALGAVRLGSGQRV